MTPTSYQKPEIRDSNDNIIQQGSFGKNTALSNATNDGWIDYVANDLEALKSSADSSAPINSPAFTGTPTAPTPTSSDDSTKIATTEFVHDNTDNKLPLTGGTMTGGITFSSVDIIKRNLDNNYIQINGGTDANGGAIAVSGKSRGSGYGGVFEAIANDGTNRKILLGKPDGTLTWSENNVLTASNYNNYALPLSGGTMNGTIKSNVETIAARNSNDAAIVIAGGSSWSNGAYLSLSGKDRTGSASGQFSLSAKNDSRSCGLLGRTDGTLIWDGQPIQTSSDKRLKQDFADVPADVLEAWGKVEWKQFKYKADVERKGDSCRFHTGLVAQDVKEVGEENNVDLLKYGILCHDVREAVEEEKDEDGNVVREASEAVDLWTVRYEEALAMEVIYLRNEIKKLREEISKLK